MITIRSERLRAVIAPLGAELQSLTDGQGREYLWNGDPAWWNGRAPILFPIVGTLNGDTLRVDGRDYRMAKHGFARRSIFAVVEEGYEYATFRLEANEASRASYPYHADEELRFLL